MAVLKLVANQAGRSLASMFPGFFASGIKHDHYKDFGYPEQVTFDQLFRVYHRNGIARAGVDKTVGKTWESNPWLLERPRDDGDDTAETPLERDVRERFADLRVWQHLAEADRRGLVGAYGGLILRVADSKAFDQPVERVTGGLLGLVEVIPAWEGQLTVSQWDMDQTSETYGQPAMFQFNEASVGKDRQQPRSFNVHPDRVIVWSRDGTVHGRPFLEPGYNALLDIEKIIGAGGEGFWKNAKSAPVLEVDKEANLEAMARAMGVPATEILDKMNEQVSDWQQGFDQLLMLQGMQSKTLQVTLPSPEHFFAIALQSFAASVGIPLKILVGSQTGERASTEDANEWARTTMSRRTNQTIPNIMLVINRLEQFGIIPEREWALDWGDLTESSLNEKIARADKMADVNQKMRDTGEIIFLPEEIRAVVDLEPLPDADKYRDEPGPAESGVLPEPGPEGDPEQAEA